MNREKLKEAAWLKHFQTIWAGSIHPDDTKRVLKETFSAGYDAARNEWHKIEDELPEKDGGYLTTYDQGGGIFAVGELFLQTQDYEEDSAPPYRRRWEAGGDGWPSDVPVIAWMPLPQPYQPEED